MLAFAFELEFELAFEHTSHTLPGISAALVDILFDQQLQLLGKSLRAPVSSPLHSAAFIPGTQRPLVAHYIRRVGRPHKEWVSEMMKIAIAIVGSWARVVSSASSKLSWNSTLQNHFKF